MFDASTVVSIGPIHVPISLASQVIGALIALGWISYEGKKYSIPWAKSFFDTLTQALLVGIVVYKFWPVTEEPLLYFKEPVRMLFTSGGAYAIEAVLLCSISWLVWRGARGKWLGWIAAGWILFTYLVVELLQSLLVTEYGELANILGWEGGEFIYPPTNIIESIVYLFLVAILIYEGKFILDKAKERVGIILVGSSSVSLLKHSLLVIPAEPFFLGLDLSELLSLFVFIVGVFILLVPQRHLTHQMDKSHRFDTTSK